MNLAGRLDYKKFAEIGIRKIIVRVFQDEGKSGGLFFNSTLFRTIDTRLETIIAEVDAQKQRQTIDLCAWMIARRFSWVSDSNLFDYQYRNGKRESIKKFDIFNPSAINRIVEVFKELAKKNIDAILIQDDLMLRYNEGFSNWGKAAFAGAAGLPANERLMMKKDTPYNLKWQAIKIKQVNKVLASIVTACKSVKPGIKIGINIYYEAPLYPGSAAAWYAHDLQEIVKTGVDCIYLMSYHRQIKKELRLTESDNRILFWRIIDRAHRVCNDRLVVKLQVRDWQTGRRIPASEIKAYLEIIPAQVRRVCFTAVKPGDLAYLQEIIGSSAKVEK